MLNSGCSSNSAASHTLLSGNGHNVVEIVAKAQDSSRNCTVMRTGHMLQDGENDPNKNVTLTDKH